MSHNITIIDKYKSTYEKQRAEIIRSIYSNILFEKNWKILDIGGGIGFHADMLKKYSDNIIILDSRKENVYICTNKGYKALVLNVDKGLPFSESSFNFINALEIIEHLISPTSFINEIKRVLKPYGYLVISTPNRHSLEGLKGKIEEITIGRSWNAWDDTHKHIFSYNEFIGAIESHFEIIACIGYYLGFMIKRKHLPPFLWRIKFKNNFLKKFCFSTIVVARNKKFE